MYTQCPDCSTAFRVTAAVLKQAAGKVRCGGCGSAFNALEYLSEQMPETPAAKEPEPSLPELKPEPLADDAEIPQSISAEQSAALLKTLDELAGSNIRIEDTGIEWRVLEDDEAAEPIAEGDMAGMFATHVTTVDELLDESPTPVDQFLTATPNDIEAAEIFEESASGPPKTQVDELRFDDNTPLPDDFDLDDGSPHIPGPVGSLEPDEEPLAVAAEPQADLELSNPEEWTDILDEFDVLGEPSVPPLAAELETLAVEPETAHTEGMDPDTPEPRHADEILDVDTQFALQAEAMGIDLSGMHEAPDVDTGDEVAKPEASDEVEAEAEPEASDEVEAEAETEASDEVEAEAETEASDEVEAEAEAEASDETGVDDDRERREAAEPDEVIDDEEVEAVAAAEGEQDEEMPERQAPLEFGAIEKELEELEEQSDVFDEDYFDSAVGGDEETAAEDGGDEDAADVIEAFEFEADLEFDEQPDLKEDLDVRAEPYPEEELELGGAAEIPVDEQPDADDTGREDEHVIPPMTEEEQTINMMIDQDLMSMAVKDDDGFASTIVIADKDADAKASKKDKGKRKKKKKKKDKAKDELAGTSTSPGFETIIMEGEIVRTAVDEDRFESQAAEAAALVEQAKAEEAARMSQSRGKRVGLIGGVAALVLLLLIQGVHQSRETLATIPAINSVLSPIYRLLGNPLSPSWDVRGWRFEATREVVGDNDTTLTIYSRIGNNSEKPLPYPLINISLTDRFEETIGSRMLDPADYLSAGLDPREFVAPGDNFEAVMSIQSPSAEAAGYKLKPCYRFSDGQLRCHIPDFK